MTLLGFTRPSKRIKDSVREAEDMGFEVMAAPSLDILPGEDSEFLRLEESLSDGCVVVFCSITAVEECQKRFGDGLPPMFGGHRIVSIGPSTSAKLESVGLKADPLPEEFSSQGLVELLRGDVSGRRVILVRSDSGSDVLSDGLREAGADLVDVASYRLVEVGMSNALLHMLMTLKRGRFDVLAFSSPKSAETFVASVEGQFGKERGDGYLRNVRIAAIGAPTSKRLESLGFPPDIVPEDSTFTDMLRAIRAEFPERGARPGPSVHQLEAAGHLAARRGEQVHLRVPPPEDLEGPLPVGYRNVLHDDPVHPPPRPRPGVEGGGEVAGEVDAVVAEEVAVEVHDVGVRLLSRQLALDEVHQELEPVGPQPPE